LAGAILIMASLWYRAPNHPGITGVGTMKLFKFWKCRELYNPPGYKLYLAGIILFDAGLLIQIAFNFFIK
jgi:hypothetical protein